MRRTTILAAALGATFFTPIAGLAQSAPSNLILAQATEEKAKDGAPKSERAPAAKSEAPKAPPAAREAPPQAPAAKSEAPKAPQAPAATKSDPTPPQAKDRATPRAPEAAKSERTAPIERGAEKARQDSGDAARKAKQDADAKDAAEQKSKADAARSRTEPTKAPEAKSVEPRGTERSKAVDDRRGPSQQQIQRQMPQTEERVRDRDGDRRDVGRDRDDRRDARDRDGDRSRRGDVKRDPRDNEDIRARLRKLEQGKTSRDELSAARIEEGRRVTIDGGSRTLSREGNRVIIRSNDETRFRVGRDDRRGDPRIEQLPGGRTRSVVVYPGGYEIITVRGQRGDIIYRARRDRGGREVVLIREVSRPPLTRIDLGPLQLRIPREQYIIDSRRASRNDIMIALSAPPVEPVERVYTLDEVRSFDRLRDKMRRIDVSDITFETDSAVITADQAEALEELASVINDLIDKNPGETFLIEGHTDAVGSDVYNLTLSDRRAEAIAVALSEYYDVPPENLVTQGYGEQFLKVPTEEPERENRRGAVRRVTPLVNQAAN
jgi:outer membrane protein OmpA-like peptidoglycan-associated protein